MADLSTLADLADVVAGAVVVGGVAFALVQLREIRSQRRQAASIQLVQAVSGDEFRRALRVIYALPKDLDAEGLRARGEEAIDAIYVLATPFETFGLLVHDRTLDLRTVDRLIGGVIRDTWTKIGPWARDERERMGAPNFVEWFQWLAERLAEHGDPRKAEGAYRSYAAWRP